MIVWLHTRGHGEQRFWRRPARESNGTERLLLFQLFCGDPFERRSSQKFQVFLHILYDILYSVSLNETNIGPDDVGILKHDE